MSTIERRVWVRENGGGLPEQSALWQSRVKPNQEQLELGHRVVPYVPEPDAQALADVRTLDEWAKRAVSHWSLSYSSGRYVCDVPRYPGEEGRTHVGPTPDAARHAAAEWVRSQR